MPGTKQPTGGNQVDELVSVYSSWPKTRKPGNDSINVHTVFPGQMPDEISFGSIANVIIMLFTVL